MQIVTKFMYGCTMGNSHSHSQKQISWSWGKVLLFSLIHYVHGSKDYKLK
jgi:hypothetical protein